MHLERTSRLILTIAFLSNALLVGSNRAQALDNSKQTKHPQPIVIPESSHDLSPPLRDMKIPASKVLPYHPYPRTDLGRSISGPAQLSNATKQAAASTGLNFEGIDARSGEQFPAPDPNGAVGATQYVQAVNTYLAVFNKSTGALQLGPFSLGSLWSGMSAPCGTSGEGDPIVQYDKLARRWVISHHATLSSSSYYECIAVSTSSDATGSFYRYAFQVSSYWPDYPKMGVWPDGYYFSYDLDNQNNAYQFVGELVCSYNRTAMLAGSAATSVCFQVSSTYGPRLLPADLELCPTCANGSLLPPAGEPNFFVNYQYSTGGLNLWQFHVDFQTPSNSTLTGPTFMQCQKFTPQCPGGYHLCIPQLGSSQGLDAEGGVGLATGGLTYPLPYRRFPNGPEVLLAVHAIAPGAFHWYEIHNPTDQPWVYQQGTFAPDSSYRWNASIGMDQLGDIAVGYNASSSSIYPAIRYTGRVPSDPLTTLETETSIMAGTGSETSSGRWGDYSSLSIDPTDDCTFWYTGEYLMNSGILNWNTRIASFKFSSCP